MFQAELDRFGGDGWTLPRPSRPYSRQGLPPYNSVVTSQPVSTQNSDVHLSTFSGPSSSGADSGLMPPPPPPPPMSIAETVVSSSEVRPRTSVMVTDYSLSLPTCAVAVSQSYKNMSLQEELARSRRDSLRGSKSSLTR